MAMWLTMKHINSLLAMKSCKFVTIYELGRAEISATRRNKADPCGLRKRILSYLILLLLRYIFAQKFSTTSILSLIQLGNDKLVSTALNLLHLSEGCSHNLL